MRIFKTLTRILAIVGKELVSIVRRPGALISLVLGPFLIMALFGIGYSGFRRPLDTIVVIPADSGLPTDAELYQRVAGEGLRISLVTTDEEAAMDQLREQLVDVVVVAPTNAQATFQAGQRSKILVRVNLTDPVQKGYTVFLARGLEAAVNGQVIEQAAKEAEGFVISQGAPTEALIPPEVVAAPAQAYIENIAPAAPTVVQYFAPAVLALILQHLAVSLIALSIVRERNSGVFELFRISPISTVELITGKLIAFGLFAGAIACSTIALIGIGFGVPMLADPIWIAAVAALLIASSLGLGLMVAAVADSEPHAVQLSLLVLLASVFFSGFVLAIAEFSEPVRALIYALPVASGIRLLGDFMFRGGTVVPWQLWMLGILTAIYVAGAWVMLRRAMARA